MQVIYHFGHKILCDAYVTIQQHAKVTLLIINTFLCDAYVIVDKFLFDGYLTMQNK